MEYTVYAFYHFARIPDFERRKEPLLEFCRSRELLGTILLAAEGINGTVAGSREGMDDLVQYLRSDASLADLEYKASTCRKAPFLRMKVRLKKEIVTMGADHSDPLEKVGEYVEPEAWNALITDPTVRLIDTRNDYEVEVGTFRGAENPDLATFREFPAYERAHLEEDKERPIAMFCTGGIRCERATAYMLSRGYKKVYHLKGGILNYLEKVNPEQSLWEGECFVFDGRVTVDHDLAPGSYDQCYACRRPISEEDKRSEEYEAGVSCPRCIRQTSVAKKAAARERQFQQALARRTGRAHLGKAMEKSHA